MALAEALVHAVEIGGEEGGLVSAGAGADLDDGVAGVVGVLREEQRVELLADGVDLGGEARHVGAGERRELGIGLVRQLARIRQLALEPRESIGQTHDGREPCVLAPERLELGRVAGDERVGECPADFLRPLQCLAEPALHRLRLGGGGRFALVSPAETVHTASGVHEALLAREVRVTLGAHFHVNGRRGRAGLERIAARADRGQLLVHGMKIGLHCELLFQVSREIYRLTPSDGRASPGG